MRGLVTCIITLSILVIASCASEEPTTPRPSAVDPKPNPIPSDSNVPVIVAFGDSLTAGHGVPAEQSYPSQLQRELDRRGLRYRVVNAGVSGDTTGPSLSRIDAALAMKPKVVIIELGANDGLRGLPVEEMRRNLDTLIAKSQAAGARVLLTGMTLPLNYGPDYIRAYEAVFPNLAKERGVGLMPFFLEGVAARAEFNQDDGIHPTDKGYAVIVQNLMKFLAPLL